MVGFGGGYGHAKWGVMARFPGGRIVNESPGGYFLKTDNTVARICLRHPLHRITSWSSYKKRNID